ncbi:uncharacterized protein LOC125671622 isoform X2 [Ostrea edulis]|uniref:uncharacterized protein LOC125671622 isoform X2 n=1 Tax=Ostrea edulis TaxID=37623 RepID=UPI0024AEC0AD|nr:uncharacterized protein LOC125671622 isoform X2 [Ostrea edulis]
MYRRWIYMCLVFYLTLETSYSQCYDDKTCECHCNCCSNCLGFYCTSCNREGWSGLTANGCQRKNIAYNQTTYQKSTNTDSSNAVDEKISTYSRTEVQKNPWIKVKFDKIQRVKHMFITLSAGIGSYFVYVKNSSNENLDRESLCARIQNNERQSLKWNITCKNDQAITGDQIVILRETTRGSLIVYDIKVFQCSTGTYGYLCDKTCVKCMDNQCDGFTGVCIKGCKSGWYGDRCDVECPSDCESGSCASGNNCTRCLPGYHGIFCNELIPSNSTSSTTPYVYVVAVLGGLLLVLTITLVTFFVKRKRERERTIRMTYQTVQVGCQKTDHDYECVSIEHDYGTIDS